jgi:hypothetical protein
MAVVLFSEVAEGVRRAFAEIGSGDGRFDIRHELICGAIRQGVRDAIWTRSKKGVSETMRQLHPDG